MGVRNPSGMVPCAHAIGLCSLFALASIGLRSDPKAPHAEGQGARAAPRRWNRSAGKAFLAPIQVESLTLTPIVAAAPAAGPPPQIRGSEPARARRGDGREAGEDQGGGRRRGQRADDLERVGETPYSCSRARSSSAASRTASSAATRSSLRRPRRPCPCSASSTAAGPASRRSSPPRRRSRTGRLRGKASFEAQQDVWNEVAAKNELRKTAAPRARTARSHDAGRRHARRRLGEARSTPRSRRSPPRTAPRMVGYAVSVNGEGRVSRHVRVAPRCSASSRRSSCAPT